MTVDQCYWFHSW